MEGSISLLQPIRGSRERQKIPCGSENKFGALSASQDTFGQVMVK